jgi:hypothetical protein|tara:strand:- start:710 stop:862 length:153 start_codon:yes stop_codon:yes gene_type:complete
MAMSIGVRKCMTPTNKFKLPTKMIADTESSTIVGDYMELWKYVYYLPSKM